MSLVRLFSWQPISSTTSLESSMVDITAWYSRDPAAQYMGGTCEF